ncbi:TPA: hypothetical protein DIU27_02280 [Candidatus Collierbacteria bacterium]|uniref:Type IV pilus assembly protein PilM n=1 Tax=Candidatus Collierbacteria bacterium GW2011_GWB2_44_22 TaxID=1618387 RepID=A0A0G1HYE6_9BACT|nr:MAG: hypothetical protein UW31_C0009G0048 [Candidatus Collierbacteria bacterium GW2011_GWA2_44_13]KKT51199.1 MAG: hypothetical protein UW42_C0005G0007 [Candidatus Collierbacteria bacterium GW2011_GWB1_44_197]KKT51980.1 MAG: hypothetical protein UW44_C0005G0022 [Candidatus Collierbacteria bacterium GW2011_GWB2_44_22]KKT62276.1 MAG: hypothetical protein UW56_C0009G0050 [Candidatus Collierbacteria bacterium GW2011_GWD1_44_27]KKT66622.1 MAG: hypothetical protein UW58_C0005G0018 [Candidatus Colli
MPAKPSLGLYFNDTFIELSQVSADGKRLESFNQLVLPPGLVVNSEIKNRIGFVQVLEQLFGTAKPKTVSLNEDVVIGVNDNHVFLSEFTVPNVPGKNLNDAIEYQVRSYLPVLPSGVETDSQIIGKTNEGQIEVLLAAIPRVIIENCVATCTSAGLRVLAVEPAVFANIRIIEPRQLDGKNQLLVYLGEGFGVFSYITSGNPRFSDFLPQSEIDKAGDMSKTITSYINFANSKHPNRQVTEVILSGSRQDMEKTVLDLKTQNIVATIAVSRLAKTEVINHTLLHTSHGLSLKTFDLRPSMNLLPVDHRLRVIKERLMRTWKRILNSLLILSLFGLLALLLIDLQAIDKQRVLKTQFNEYEQQLKLPDSQQFIKQTDRLNQITGQLIALRDVTGGEENILKVLSSVTPSGISLTSVVISRNPGLKKLTDSGSSWIITGTADSRELVLGFYSNLLFHKGFADGRLYFDSLEKDVGLIFRVANITTK